MIDKRSPFRLNPRAWRTKIAAIAALAFAVSSWAAEVVIVNADAPGVGFNDPTPTEPVGGNAGTTLGEQRLNVFKFVAQYWGERLESAVPISVLASFQPLSCTATSGVLGSAGPISVWSDFPGAQKLATWYPSALANKLASQDLFPGPDPTGADLDIIAFFNGDLGKPGCLNGLKFYLGLDGEAGTDINLVVTVLHEIGHGLGFATYTRGSTGEQFGPPSYPSIWDHYLFDPKIGKTWSDMTIAERKQSAITPRNLAWNGATVRESAPAVLERGTPDLYLFGPGLNKFVLIGTAEFGPPLTAEALAGTVVKVVDRLDGKGFACTPLSEATAASTDGKIALIDRGDCPFTIKVKNAQDAGAVAVLIADNAPGTPPANMPGVDDSISIPSVRITQADGVALKTAIDTTPQPFLPVAVLFENQFKLAGADYAGRVYLYTPDPFRPGSSVSHYDTSAKPSLLMEPFINAGQPIAVSKPDDLTLELLRDIGW